MGSSRPVFENSCNCCFLMLAVAKGASFCPRTPLTTTSCNRSNRSESSASVSLLLPSAKSGVTIIDATMVAAIVIEIFFIVNTLLILINTNKGRVKQKLFPTRALSRSGQRVSSQPSSHVVMGGKAAPLNPRFVNRGTKVRLSEQKNKFYLSFFEREYLQRS